MDEIWLRLYIKCTRRTINCFCLMVFNATFNNISVISWRSILLVEETEGPGKTTDLSQVTETLYHIRLYTSSWSRFALITSVEIGTHCIGSCKSNNHTITATMVPHYNWRIVGMQEGLLLQKCMSEIYIVDNRTTIGDTSERNIYCRQ